MTQGLVFTPQAVVGGVRVVIARIPVPSGLKPKTFFCALPPTVVAVAASLSAVRRVLAIDPALAFSGA